MHDNTTPPRTVNFVIGYSIYPDDSAVDEGKIDYDDMHLLPLKHVRHVAKTKYGNTYIRTDAYSYYVHAPFETFIRQIGCIGRPVKKGHAK